MGERAKDWICAAAIALATLALFAPALGFDFIREWDDVQVILSNPHYRGFDLARLRWMFSSVEYPPYYIPVSWLSWAAVHAISSLDPWGYHAEIILYHAASAALLFALLRTAGLGRFACAAGALLWAAHPMRVEAVAQVAAKPYAFAAMWALAATLAYALHARARLDGVRRPALYACAIFLYLLSLLSHPQGVGVCLAWVVVEIAWRRSSRSEAWRFAAVGALKPALPFLLAAAAVAAVTLAARSATPLLRPAPTLDQFGLASRAAQAGYVTFHYVWKPFWPASLSPIYVSLLKVDPAAPKFAFAALAVALATAASLLYARRNPWPAALWLSYLFLVAPVWGLKAHPHYVNDRYSYFPHLVLAIVPATILSRLTKEKAELQTEPSPRAARASSPVIRSLASAAAIAGIAALAFSSFKQQKIWQNSVALFEHILANLGGHPYRADILPRMGFVRLQRGELPQAEECARATLATGQNKPMGLRLLAETQLRSARQAEAYHTFQDLLDIDPKNVPALLAIAAIDQRLGDLQRAEWRYEQAVSADPRNAQAALALANLKLGAGEWSRAAVLYERSIQLDPAQPDAHNGLGAAYASQGKIEQAAACFRRALKFDPENKTARANLEMATRQLTGRASAKQP